MAVNSLTYVDRLFLPSMRICRNISSRIGRGYRNVCVCVCVWVSLGPKQTEKVMQNQSNVFMKGLHRLTASCQLWCTANGRYLGILDIDLFCSE